MTGRWQSSTRRSELPSNWPTLRRQVKARAHGKCEASAHAANCDGIGKDCDHVGDRHDHSLANLQWLSGPCHAAKTQAEAQAAKPQRKRTPELHPGRIA